MIKPLCAKFRKQNHPNNTLLLTWAAFLSHFRPILHDLATKWQSVGRQPTPAPGPDFSQVGTGNTQSAASLDGSRADVGKRVI